MPKHSLSLHDDIIFQCYRSIAVAGVFAVFGLIVMTAFGEPFYTLKGQSCDTLDCWLGLRPANYGLALFICILFGYSQRLWSGLLNKAEEVATEYVEIHSKI